MPRDYFFAFGSANPASAASLAPTFITFVNASGSTFPAPSIAEKYPGSGLYYVSYGATQTMAFVLDGATTGLAASDRYISGVFDPYDMFGATLNAVYAFGNSAIALGNSNLALGTSNIALGNTSIALESIGLTAIASNGLTLVAQGATLVAIGNTLLSLGFTVGGLALAIGSTASAIGSTAISPADVMGFLMRAREFAEGNQTYTKATGALDYYVRGGVTLLIEKTVSDSSLTTTKT